MKIFNLYDYDASVYGLDCRALQLAGTSANVLSCSLPVGCQSEAHNHFEREVFIFVSGGGKVSDGTSTHEVKAGQAVEFDGLTNHIITNTSLDQPLKLISVYWPSTAPEERPAPDGNALIFSTPPTPNGDLHLGHLSGPYVAGDMLRRAYLMAGGSAVHVTGRDDHQTYVVTKARREGSTPEAIADTFSAMIRSTWSRANVPLDYFIEPDRRGPYAAFVQHGVARLMEAGWIVEKDEDALFDSDGRYLHEAFVTGKCPHCGEGSDGNACEACGRPNRCVDLISPRSTLTGSTPSVGRQKRLYFKLSAFQEALSQYVKSASMSAHVLDMCLGMLERGLPDICISHPGNWGIAHALGGYEDQIIYVWFEMAFGYLWAASQTDPSSAGDTLARAKDVYERWRTIHCYGFDNAHYHTLLFPAIYMGLGIAPPAVHIVNELMDLDGSKFSTSRNHLIWSRDLLDCIPSDYVRFAVTFNRPEGVREDFSLDTSLATLNDLFPGRLARWVSIARSRLAGLDGAVPEPGAWLAEHARHHRSLVSTANELKQALRPEAFSAKGVASALGALILDGERFARTQESLFSGGNHSGHNYCRTALALDLLGLKLVARAARVAMPALAAELESLLQLEATSTSDPLAFLEPGTHLRFDGPLTLPRADASKLRDYRHAHGPVTRAAVSVDAAPADVS